MRTLLGRGGEPRARLLEVLVAALPVRMHGREVALRVRVLQLGGYGEELERSRVTAMAAAGDREGCEERELLHPRTDRPWQPGPLLTTRRTPHAARHHATTPPRHHAITLAPSHPRIIALAPPHHAHLRSTIVVAA